jgi:2-iminoacetate synthase
MTNAAPVAWINETVIADARRDAEREDASQVRAILAKARDLKGLGLREVAVLSAVTAPDLLAEMFEAARFVKDEIYGQRIVFFAPLYFSNICQNECTYHCFGRN